tara:strand:+ start:5299 stop:5934 length:636 start_codon:yes stop_codon:yes gene_type:complete
LDIIKLKQEENYWDAHAALRIKIKGKSVSYNDNFYKRSKLLQKLLDYNFDETDVLEIGCAFSTISLALKVCANLNSYKGIDVSEKYCEFARRVMGADARKAKVNCLPFESDSFNALFAFDVFEHINPSERLDSYVEIDRVLQNNARIFINNPLEETKHDLNFDHEFNDKHIVELSSNLGMRIDKLQKYTVVLPPDSNKISYQWIVMSRGNI